jgi:hypothetical protein
MHNQKISGKRQGDWTGCLPGKKKKSAGSLSEFVRLEHVTFFCTLL